jgi:hypothetical protein
MVDGITLFWVYDLGDEVQPRRNIGCIAGISSTTPIAEGAACATSVVDHRSKRFRR